MERAEPIAFADLLSAGRVEIGIGLGNSLHEFAVFGIPLKESPARYAEAREIIGRTLSGETLTYPGQFF